MVSVPDARPVTTPPDVTGITVAAALLVLHIPPVATSVNVVDEPMHTPERPVMLPASGCGRPVINIELAAVPQALVT